MTPSPREQWIEALSKEIARRMSDEYDKGAEGISDARAAALVAAEWAEHLARKSQSPDGFAISGKPPEIPWSDALPAPEHEGREE